MLSLNFLKNRFVGYYERENKPTSRRVIDLIGESYEEALLKFIKERYYMIHGGSFLGMNLNNDVFFYRTECNTHICKYEVYFIGIGKKDETKKFLVELHPIRKIDEKVLFEEIHGKEMLKEPKRPNEPKLNKKEYTLTKWVKEESQGVKWFLIQLDHAGDLKKLKEEMSKSTYYRNLKICKEKGYIKSGKLVRRIYTSLGNQ